MLLGGLPNGQLQIPQQLVIIVNQSEINCDALLHGGLRKPLSHPSAIGFVGDLLANLGHVVLPVGLLHMRQQLGPFPHERHAPPQQVPGSTHRGGVDVGLGQHAAAQQHGNFLGIDLVIFGLPAVDGFHVQRMPEDKRHPCACTQIGQPVPREDACDTDDHVGSIRCDSVEKRFWASWHVPVHQNLTILVQDTQVHGAGMQIDAAVQWVLLGVESH
jgi:hypothetical protein